MAILTNVLNKLHPKTGEDLKPTLAPTWRDGSVMTDAKCGGLYNKDSNLSGVKYFKWNAAGPWPVSRLTTVNQSNFQKLINDFGVEAGTIFIDKTVNITSNITIPENINLIAACPIPFNVSSGVTLTILSAINEGSRRIFSGSGVVKMTAVSRINICWFGAKGDSNGFANNGTNSGPAINKTLESASFTGARVFIPEGGFRTEESINMTKIDANGNPIIMEGVNKSRSIIIGDLKDGAYPVIDCCNNKRGSLNSLMVKTTTSSLDTCSVFLAEDQATGVNLFELNDTIIQNQSPNGKAGLIGWCADQLKFSWAETGASGASCVTGFYLGGINKYNIQSKFITPQQFTGDLTYVSSINSNFSCAGSVGVENYVIEVEEYSLVSFTKDYFAPTGINFSGAIVSLKSGTRNMQPVFKECRTEGGISEGSADVFKIVDFVYNGEFSGSFLTRTQGGVFTGPGTMLQCKFDGSINPRLFRDGGAIKNCRLNVTSGPNVFGTLSADGLVGSYNNELAGRLGDLENVISGKILGVASGSTPMGSTPGLRLGAVGISNNVRFDSTTDGMLMPSVKTPINYRKAFVGDSSSLVINSYIGGSGMQLISSFTLPIAVFNVPANPPEVKALPFIDFEIWGDTPTTFATSGQIQISLVQDGNTVVLGTLTTIPAGQSGFKAYGRLLVNSASASLISCMLDIDSAPSGSGARRSLSKYTNLTSAGIVKTGSDLTININALNTADSPIAHIFRTIRG